MIRKNPYKIGWKCIKNTHTKQHENNTRFFHLPNKQDTDKQHEMNRVEKSV